MERIFENEIEFGKELVEMEEKICDFVSRLEEGQYKVIVYNNQTPILKGALGLVELIVCDLNEDSKVELKNNDTLVIHTENKKITLTGRKRMKDGEIILRQYLSEECWDNQIIIRDKLDQIEIEQENIHKIDDVFVRKCKDVYSIRMILDEDDPNYNNNWDCLLVRFKQNPTVEQVWQRC